MDLGISGRRALVCASSQGLGLACATALAREGVLVTLNSRNAEHLDEAARGIEAAFGVRPATIVANINSEAGRQTLLDGCGEVDILVNNNAGPPPGALPDWDHAA